MCDKHTHGYQGPETDKKLAEHCCRGGRLERFLEPCLLLLLCQDTSHGYELIQRLCDFGFAAGSQDPGHIYRHLRRLEREGMVTSRWETGTSGPAKRLYEVTEEGRELLAVWTESIKENIDILQFFLQRYGALK